MYDRKTHSVPDRIVSSISQPHVRPIVRGKARANVEFGAKLAISAVEGFAYLERLSWDNFNKGMTLRESVERYKLCHVCYPELVHVDAIYCQERGIRISCPRFGWPPKEPDPKEIRRPARKPGCFRCPITPPS
jgi:IS5 family transposase